MLVNISIVKILFKFIFKNSAKYKILKINRAINSPLKRINKPDDSDSKNIFKTLFFFITFKKYNKNTTDKNDCKTIDEICPQA